MIRQKYFIDNAKPIELEYILRTIPRSGKLERNNLIGKIEGKWSFNFQKRFFDSVNRLVDLGLILKTKDKGMEKLGITNEGRTIKEILEYDHKLYHEIIHFLHYSAFTLAVSKKPYFWSYKRLSDLLWDKQVYNSDIELAGEISVYIQEHFNTTQAPFDGGTIQKFFSWLKVLEPPILHDKKIKKRHINYPELFLISLDMFYKTNNLKYGDPMLINDESMESVCKPFFISIDQFDELLKTCRRLWPHLREKSAFQGSTLILTKKYLISNIVN